MVAWVSVATSQTLDKWLWLATVKIVCRICINVIVSILISRDYFRLMTFSNFVGLQCKIETASEPLKDPLGCLEHRSGGLDGPPG